MPYFAQRDMCRGTLRLGSSQERFRTEERDRRSNWFEHTWGRFSPSLGTSLGDYSHCLRSQSSGNKENFPTSNLFVDLFFSLRV